MIESDRTLEVNYSKDKYKLLQEAAPYLFNWLYTCTFGENVLMIFLKETLWINSFATVGVYCDC